uniref:F-box domain-containing protein n=2 Tax=Acrobeloides nanus TaxID=290746 RepID=A0A914DW17_9BILA
MDYLTKLPSELKLRVLNHLTDASDIVKIKTLNRTFYDFSYKFALELARFEISTVELRGSDQPNGRSMISMNLSRRINGVDHLWKYNNYYGLDVSPITSWSQRVMFSPGVVQIRLYNLIISPKNINSIKMFVRNLLPNGFEKGQIEFKLYLVSCDFYETTMLDLQQFFGFFISLGVETLIIEDLPRYVISDLCHSLSRTDIHLVNTLRLHFTDSENLNMDSALFHLLTTVCRTDRRMTKLIIDGHPIPMPTIAEFISEFCASPYVDISPSPPYIRCFFSIDTNMNIADVKELREMAHVRINARKRKTSALRPPGAKRRRTQIFVEFGYYEEDLPINQTLHCVIGLSVNEWTQERRLASD